MEYGRSNLEGSCADRMLLADRTHILRTLGCMMVKLCPFCGYNNLTKDSSPNGGELLVSEVMIDGMCTECYDPEIVMYTCSTCKEVFYAKDN